MEKSLEKTGKTIDEAISSALLALGLDRDAVSVEVLEKPKAGFLGIGGTPARVRVTYDEPEVVPENFAVTLLEGLLSRMGLAGVTVTAAETEDSLALDVSGPNMGHLIGRRGETLDAVQRVMATAVNRGREKMVHVTVDTEQYRAKREESLISIAVKTAERAVKYRRNIALEPMNSYARHVVHTALQDMEGVSTHSVGVEPQRRVVISVPGGTDERIQERRPDNRSAGGYRGGFTSRNSPDGTQRTQGSYRGGTPRRDGDRSPYNGPRKPR